jgi:hypothetical protein
MTKKGNRNIEKRTIRLLLIVFVIAWMSGIHSFANSVGLDGKSSHVEIGIFNTGCGEFEIRAKPSNDLSGTMVTNIQFTVRWPENTVNLFNFASAFYMSQQGPVYQSGGYSYAIFTSATPIPINWTSGNEYVVLTFFHDQSELGYADFNIADDAWTQTNNGLFYFELLGIDNTGIIYHQAENTNLGGCGNVDIGIFYTDCSDFEIRAKPLINFTGSSVTNIQFTLRWPENTVNFINFISSYSIVQQGPVYQSGGFNYGIFISATAASVNWVAGDEYTLLSFSHDQSGTGYADFTISNDSWAQTHNGMYYFELLGLDETGSFYHQANNSWLGTCGEIDAGLFTTGCGDFEVRLKPHDNYSGTTLTNLQFTISWPENSVNLFNFSTDYDVLQQGPVYSADGVNYAIFASATPLPVNWSAEFEYSVLTFSHDQTGTGYADFLISYDTWTQTNNGLYFVELLGINKTGVIYHQAENAFLGECGVIEIGLFNTDCADFEVRLKPHVDFPDNTLTNVQFTIKWPANSVNLIDFVTGFGVEQQGPVTVANDTNYTVFISATTYPVNWIAETEYTILTFSHDQSGLGFGDISIDTSDWAAANNGVYYVELLGLDYTGEVYHNAGDAYFGTCGIVDVRVILQGPYNAVTGKMNTTLNNAGNLPLYQTFNTAPWNYLGTEQVISFPDSIVDWVLVELRDKTSNTLILERKAGLLSKSGMVVQSDFTAGLHFNIAESLDSFYVVVWHRNHMPVMSGLPVALPNLGEPYDFTEMVITQPYKHNDPFPAELELNPAGSGKYGMIAGDINANKELKYLGSGNDRSLIVQRLVNVTGSSNLNVIISGYYNEDINLDNQLIYLGSANDRGIILSNLIKLTGLTNLNSIYNSVVP